MLLPGTFDPAILAALRRPSHESEGYTLHPVRVVQIQSVGVNQIQLENAFGQNNESMRLYLLAWKEGVLEQWQPLRKLTGDQKLEISLGNLVRPDV